MKKEVQAFFLDGKTAIAFAPGAGQEKKKWPLERFIELARRQQNRGRKCIFLLGPAEEQYLSVIQKSLPEASFPLQENALFLSNPLYSICFAGHCACAIANDSGIGHLIGLAQIPLISLFGPTGSNKLRPYTAHVKTIMAQDFGGDTMDRIPVDIVEQHINQILI